MTRQALDTSLTVGKVAVRLRGLIYDSHGRAMSPSDSRGRGGRVYRYYVSQAVLKGGATEQPAIARLPAGEIEAVVIAQVRALLRQPEMVVGTWRAARSMAPDVTEQEVLLLEEARLVTSGLKAGALESAVRPATICVMQRWEPRTQLSLEAGVRRQRGYDWSSARMGQEMDFRDATHLGAPETSHSLRD